MMMTLTTPPELQEMQEVLGMVNLTPAERKVHIANMKLKLFVHRITTEQTVATELKSPFKIFLLLEDYDEILAIKTLCAVHMFEELLFIMRAKRLHQLVIPTMISLFPTMEDPTKLNGFWELMSDPLVTETLIANESNCSFHAGLIKKHLDSLPDTIWANLEKLYDPYQPSVRCFISDACENSLSKSVWVETYLMICIHLSAYSPGFVPESLPFSTYQLTWEIEQSSKMPFRRKLISAGFRHGCFIRNGIVYSWGTTDSGCLGRGPTTNRIGSPKAVDVLSNQQRKFAIAVCCGKSHTVVLTNDGVYSWGHNNFGQLGIGSNVLCSPYPARIDGLTGYRITCIAVGQYHCLAIDDAHCVFSWGWNSHGQLGHGTVEDISTPKIITALIGKRIRNVSAGHAHSIFLDCTGLVWACGNDSFGQLGTSEFKKVLVPIKIFGLYRRMSNIAAGYFHNCAISCDGNIYQWGKVPIAVNINPTGKRRNKSSENEDYSIVMAEDNSEPMVPKKLHTSSIPDPIVKISLGCEHAAALTTKGKLYVWGGNSDGQLGFQNSVRERKSRQQQLDPVHLPMKTKIVDIACGWNFTLAVDVEGKVWTWGGVHHFKGSRAEQFSCLSGEILVTEKQTRILIYPQPTGHIFPRPTIIPIHYEKKVLPMYKAVKIPAPLVNQEWRMKMHFTIEINDYYNSITIFEECLKINEHDACSKLWAMSGDFVHSIEEKLKTTSDEMQRELVIHHYLSLDIEDVDVICAMLLKILIFFDEKQLNFPTLELVLSQHEDNISLALFQLLFGLNSEGSTYIFFFSTPFKVRLVHKVFSFDGFATARTIFEGFSSVDVVNALEFAGEFINNIRSSLKIRYDRVLTNKLSQWVSEDEHCWKKYWSKPRKAVHRQGWPAEH